VLHVAVYGEFVESGTEQRVVLPWLKVTVPAGLTEPDGTVRVAVKAAAELIVTAPVGTVVKESVAAEADTVWPPVKVPELLLKLPAELTKFATTVCGEAAAERLDIDELVA
jgi:hypothetical protein